MVDNDYFPQEFFSSSAPPEQSPRVIIAPHRYIQGKGVFDNLGHYVSILDCQKSALFISKGGAERFGNRLLESLKRSKIEPIFYH